MSAFSHNNPFSILQDYGLNDDDYGHLDKEASATLAPDADPQTHTMMPPGDSKFWACYGDKLRVNGTIEEVCTIERFS